MSNKSKSLSLASGITLLVLIVLCMGCIVYAVDKDNMSIAFFALGGFALIMFIIALIDQIRKKPAKPNPLILIIPSVTAVIFIALGLLIHFSFEFEMWLHWGGWILLVSILLFVTGIILAIVCLRKYLSRKRSNADDHDQGKLFDRSCVMLLCISI